MKLQLVTLLATSVIRSDSADDCAELTFVAVTTTALVVPCVKTGTEVVKLEAAVATIDFRPDPES